jgi:phosphoglycerol transferase MdoB-like AlkP superfamily enzyme
MSGNKLNATPYLNQLSNNGIYFDRCFTPTFGTARGLFALLTGIPDVQFSKFSTRNPNAVVQHTILNDFYDYEKYYFIGGGAEFNNFKGMINNIGNVKLFEEESFKSKKHNVWGISDKNLMLEACDILQKETKPFVAVIQTADNHEPFTIPEEDLAFGKKIYDNETIKNNGFKSLNEFNATLYFDYCIAQFMQKARSMNYFDNTIFVFIGDHGVIGDARTIYPPVWTSHRLTEEHVPLILYAPKLIAAQKRTETVSQIDVLPTIAALTGQRYHNTTLGRDLLDSNKKGSYAFTIFHDAGKIGIVSDSFYFIHNFNTDEDELLPMQFSIDMHQVNIPFQVNKYHALADAYYETSKWMLTHNRKRY